MAAHDNMQPQQFDYRGGHQPHPSYAPLHDLTQTFPDDVYTAPKHYLWSEQHAMSHQAARAALGARGKPDLDVDIYRAAPRGVEHINPGDWVTTSESYARMHGYQQGPSDDDAHPVLRARVKARDVRSGGNDLFEYGYHGPASIKADIHHPGGKVRDEWG